MHHHSVQSEFTICCHLHTFIFHAQVQTWFTRLSFWHRCRYTKCIFFYFRCSSQNYIFSSCLYRLHLSPLTDLLAVNHQMCSHMQDPGWLNILGFSCSYSSTPIGGNAIILTEVSVEHCRVSQVSLKSQKSPLIINKNSTTPAGALRMLHLIILHNW